MIFLKKDEKEKKTKKILFSEEIDNAINGYAIGVSFLAIGLFLLIKPDYFRVQLVSYIIGAIIGLIGFFGTGIELSKSSKIKGLDNLSIGVVVLAIWLFTYVKISALWANIVFFLLLVLGAYSICLGLFQGAYSIVQNIKSRQTENNSKSSIVSQIILFSTQICGLVLAVVNVMKAIGKL